MAHSPRQFNAARYNAAVTAPEDNAPKPRRRWLRFSLWTLLVVMLLLGVVFGVLGIMANEARRQRKVVADLEEMGARIMFSDEEASLPEWLDAGYCNRVTECDLDNTQIADLSPLAELKNLEVLDLSGTRVTDVSPLAELKSLILLALPGTKVTDQQVNALQQALPNCIIVR